MGRHPLLTLTLTLTLTLLAACSSADAEQGTEGVDLASDSILPMPVMIERFQAKHTEVTGFDEDAPASRGELIARFAQAVRDSSVGALRALTVSEAEFAWLVFPTSMFSAPPYAQPPEVNWLLTEQNGLKGETRLLREYGGRALDVAGHECEAEPRAEGGNTIWNSCRLALRQPDGSVLEGVRLFGSIIERGGRYRFMSLANKL